jgi:hypothetical protein
MAPRPRALWPDLEPSGPRGFPLCGECRAEGIGPGTPWCVRHWTPERDPAGAAIARRLGLLPLAAVPPGGQHQLRAPPDNQADEQDQPGHEDLFAHALHFTGR